MGFSLEFLEPNFNDLNKFGEWFEKSEINTKNFSSLAVTTANNLTNNFLEKITL